MERPQIALDTPKTKKREPELTKIKNMICRIKNLRYIYQLSARITSTYIAILELLWDTG